MKQTAFFFALLFITLANCTKEPSIDTPDVHSDLDETKSFEFDEFPHDHPYQELLMNHQIDLTNAELVVRDLPDGSTENVYLVEGDITLSIDAYREQQKRSNQRQAAHKYTVKGISQIGVYCSTSDWKLSQAVNRAINNYNNLNGVNIQFVRVPFSYLAMIHVYKSTYAPFYGGEAGYPNPSIANLVSGKIYPYKWVRVGYGVSNLSLDAIEHVVTHEIGHCIGVWHTDWNSGFSCGTFTPDATPAWQIYGTPTYDPASIMNKCYSSDTNGEFSYFDAFALNILF